MVPKTLLCCMISLLVGNVLVGWPLQSALATSDLTSGPPATGGTTDPSVLSTIPDRDDWDALKPAMEVQGPARGRYRRDGSLVAVLRGGANGTDVKPATAMTADRLDNNVCMITPWASDACKRSPNGRFRLCLQQDGNIVLYDNNSPYWASNTQGRASGINLRLCMQADGNLVAYDRSLVAFWASNTRQSRPSPLTAFIQNDGNFIAYDGKCSSFYATNTVRATAAPPACSPSGSTVRVTIPPASTTGPFGGGKANSPAAFDDMSFSNNGANRITQVNVRSGSWIDAIQFKYGSTAAPWRGGNGGTPKTSLNLAADEWIAQAWVRSGGFVDEIKFLTNKGRYWSSTGSTSQTGDWGSLASPCPLNGYRLIAIKGTGGQFLERIEFIWRAVAGVQGPLTSSVAQWSYLPGESPVFRLSSTNQPQCLSRDGTQCARSRDAYSLRMCADSLSSRPVTCTAADGANDPTHWCSKARGALGVATPTIPLRIVFFNVEVCNSGLADTSSNLQRIVYTDPYSLKNYWPGASAGRVYMDETVSTIINLRVPCSVSPISECNVWKWYNYARDNPSVMGGRAFSSFQFQVFVSPKIAACAPEAPGFAAGSVSFIKGELVQDFDINVFKHEIGHNLGLPHSGRIIPPSDAQGYGDDTTPMGFCHRCIYSSIDQLRLGWSRSLPVVDWSTFSGSNSVFLPILSASSTYSELGAVVIRLQDPRDPGVPSGFTREIYLSYKVAANQDQGVPAKYSARTHVHAMDTMSGDSWLLAWLMHGGNTGVYYVNEANRLVVAQTAANARGAYVTICKWVSSSDECGYFVPFVRTSLEAASEPTFDREAYYHGHQWIPGNVSVLATASDVQADATNDTSVTMMTSSSVTAAVEPADLSTGAAATIETEEGSTVKDSSLP